MGVLKAFFVTTQMILMNHNKLFQS